MKTVLQLPATDRAPFPVSTLTLELLQNAFDTDSAQETSIFELSAENLPQQNHKYGVVAGINQAIKIITEGDLGAIIEHAELTPEVTAFLSKFRFTGTITGYQEGDSWFPGSPVVTIVAPLAEALLVAPVIAASVTAASAVAHQASVIRRAVGAGTRLHVRTYGTSLYYMPWLVEAALIGGFDSSDNPVVNAQAETFPVPFELYEVDSTEPDFWFTLPEAIREGETTAVINADLPLLRKLRLADLLPAHAFVDGAQFILPPAPLRFSMMAVDTDQPLPNQTRTAWRECNADWKPVAEHVLLRDAPGYDWTEQQMPYILKGRPQPADSLPERVQRHLHALENVPVHMSTQVDGGQVVWQYKPAS